MEAKKTWYVVYTRSRWEKKVAVLFTRKGIENFCPLNRVLRQWADRRKMVEEPLFRSYVFVHIEEADHLAVQRTEGVVDFVYWLGKPAVVKSEEIAAIRQYLNNSYALSLEKMEVNVNDTVRITSGALVQQEGSVLEVQNSTIKILLPSLGYAIIAVKTGQIEKITVPVQIMGLSS